MTVYLLHFSRPIGNPANTRGQAQHYIGSAEDLEARLQEHRSGRGAKITAYLAASGIDWKCVRIWDGGRRQEKKLKARHNATRLCPVCAEQARERQRAYPRRRSRTKDIIPF